MTKRSYRQNCALALAADLIGERWTLLLIRDLLVGPKRYSELNQSLAGMGTNLLATRLRELQSAGIIENTEGGYRLTEAGRGLEPAILALVRWGMAYIPDRHSGYHHQDDWDLVALKAAFDPARQPDLAVRTQFVSDKLSAWVDIRDREMNIGRGEIDQADLKIDGSVEDLFIKAKDPERLLASGSRSKLRKFMSAFAL